MWRVQYCFIFILTIVIALRIHFFLTPIGVRPPHMIRVFLSLSVCVSMNAFELLFTSSSLNPFVFFSFSFFSIALCSSIQFQYTSISSKCLIQYMLYKYTFASVALRKLACTNNRNSMDVVCVCVLVYSAL